MKKRNEASGVVNVSGRILGLLGRRKVDPTTEAMRTLKPEFVISENYPVGDSDAFKSRCVMVPFDVPRFALPLHLQQSGRFMRQPGLTTDEQQRLIDVLEKHLA